MCGFSVEIVSESSWWLWILSLHVCDITTHSTQLRYKQILCTTDTWVFLDWLLGYPRHVNKCFSFWVKYMHNLSLISAMLIATMYKIVQPGYNTIPATGIYFPGQSSTLTVNANIVVRPSHAPYSGKAAGNEATNNEQLYISLCICRVPINMAQSMGRYPLSYL